MVFDNDSDMEILVEIVSIEKPQDAEGYLIFLRGIDDGNNNLILPIMIGEAEFHSIFLYVKRVPLIRPITHDLIVNIFDTLGVKMHKVVIDDLSHNTFFAKLYLTDANGNKYLVDARPSDAIAIAIRYHAPIYVKRAVIDRVAEDIRNAIIAPEEKDDEVRDTSSSVPPAGMVPKSKEEILMELEEELEKAVAEERYEDAARIRDQINKLKQELEDENDI